MIELKDNIPLLYKYFLKLKINFVLWISSHNKYSNDTEFIFYGMYGSNELLGLKRSNGELITYDNHCVQSDDIITIHLDLVRKKLVFHVNYKDYGLKFDNIQIAEDIKYYLVVRLGRTQGHAMSIVDFTSR